MTLLRVYVFLNPLKAADVRHQEGLHSLNFNYIKHKPGVRQMAQRVQVFDMRARRPELSPEPLGEGKNRLHRSVLPFFTCAPWHGCPPTLQHIRYIYKQQQHEGADRSVGNVQATQAWGPAFRFTAPYKSRASWCMPTIPALLRQAQEHRHPERLTGQPAWQKMWSSKFIERPEPEK